MHASYNNCSARPIFPDVTRTPRLCPTQADPLAGRAAVQHEAVPSMPPSPPAKDPAGWRSADDLDLPGFADDLCDLLPPAGLVDEGAADD